MSELPVTVYTPESPLRNPGALLKGMFRDLISSRELAWRLFVRDTSAQYRQSILGYLWVFIPPLVAGLPFVFLNAQGVITVKGTPIPYPAFAMIGTTIWQTFVDALNSPSRSVNTAKSMLTHINFPREAILLAGLGQVVLNVLIRLALVALLLVWFEITPPITALLVPIGIAALITVGFTAGMILVPLGSLWGDVQQTIPIAATFLMFLTPVIYPQPESGLAAVVASWNPLTPLITVTRDWLTTGASSELPAFIGITCASLALLFAAWVIYRLALPHLIARMGN